MPQEGHFTNRAVWLRAMVLGANDGIVSTASLLMGVLAAGMDRSGVLLTGVAGLTAGAISMAAGEYVSVAAQADSESADLARERKALQENPEGELQELASGLEARGVSQALSRKVAQQMTDHDALDAHAREELGLTLGGRARPLLAAFASAMAFAVGAALPILAVLALDGSAAFVGVPVMSMLALILLGVTGARAGGARVGAGVVRVLFWGCLAMLVTALVGHLFNVVV